MIKDIITGKKKVTDKLRMCIVCYMAYIIHLMLLGMFLKMDCPSLVIYNAVIIFYYLIFVRICIEREHYVVAYSMIYWEIIAHDILTCVLLGWRFEFVLYSYAVIPVSYYMAYITDKFKRKRLTTATVYAVINIVLMIGTKVYLCCFGSVYEYFNQWALIISSFNMVVCYFIMIMFSTLYVIEFRNYSMKLSRMANYDPLTNLCNRRKMHNFINDLQHKAEDEGCPVTFVMCDIDDFKQINDTYGHFCGDEVLRSVAEIMLRETGDGASVCRWGGEEILIAIQKDINASVKIVENIRRKIDELTVECEGEKISVTLTFGMASYSKGMSMMEVINTADEKLYEGKNSGKNCIIK